MDFSVIIPAYNESTKIRTDVEAVDRFVAENRFDAEIIVVDDGSTDGTRESAEASRLKSVRHFEMLSHTPRRGKGFSVRSGITKSTGDFVMFADSGNCVPYEDALKGLHLLREGQCQIAHGSRKLPESQILRPQPPVRKLISWTFRRILVSFMRVPNNLTDTQCGFKVYIGPVARQLYAACKTEGFTFDVEIILRAVQNGWVIKEFPIRWTADPDSRLAQTLKVSGIFRELLSIKKLLKNN
jgi:dolichyl-phosphate beta-glucosyltransferase